VKKARARLDKSAPAFAFLRQGGEYSAALTNARRTLIAKPDRFSPLDETGTRTLDPSIFKLLNIMAKAWMLQEL
jgi:hypothetical protein